MSAKHTPGPWKVFRVKNGENKGKVIGIGDAQAGGVTDPFGGLWRSGKELEANAELIAAAPELLDALESCVRFLNKHCPGAEHIVDAAEAAIAKATGAA